MNQMIPDKNKLPIEYPFRQAFKIYAKRLRTVLIVATSILIVFFIVRFIKGLSKINRTEIEPISKIEPTLNLQSYLLTITNIILFLIVISILVALSISIFKKYSRTERIVDYPNRNLNSAVGISIVLLVILLFPILFTRNASPSPIALVTTITLTPTLIPNTLTPTPVPTDTPTPTPIPTPIVTIAGESEMNPKIISAGDKTITTLNIQANGTFFITFNVDRGTVTKQAEGVYEYTAPDEGGLDTVTFIVEGEWGRIITQVEFRVIDIQVLSPKQEVGCPTRIACGFTISGTSTGLTDDMQIVVFVNPLDSSLDSWWRYPVSEMDENGNWQQDVFVREERVFAGYEFSIKALILSRDIVPELPRSMDELPVEQLASSDTFSLETVSHRPPLGEPLYPGQVVIDSPRHLTRGLVHNEPVTFMGSAGNVPDTMEIWTVIYIEEAGRYFPQNNGNCPNAAPASRTGSAWEAPHVSFGGEGKIQYDVVVVVLEPESETSTFFHDYLTNGCQTNDFPGLTAQELGTWHEEAAITLIVEDWGNN